MIGLKRKICQSKDEALTSEKHGAFSFYISFALHFVTIMCYVYNKEKRMPKAILRFLRVMMMMMFCTELLLLPTKYVEALIPM